MPFTRHGKVADILQRARTRADWDLVDNLYRQCAGFAADTDCGYLPDELAGLLAEAVSRISASYTDNEADLAEHALAVFAEVDGRESFNERLFRRAYQDPRFLRLPTYTASPPGRRRRPTPYEAVVETSRRLRDANKVEEFLAGVGTSAVLGGSVSYGRFFNVRGHAGSAASDLDVVIVTRGAERLRAIGDRLGLVPGVDKASLDHLMDRIDVFGKRYDDGQTVLSHKLAMWSDGVHDPLLAWADVPSRYHLSLHFMALPVLDYILVDACTKLMRDSAGTKRTVRDYRDTTPTRDDHERTFAGRNYRMTSGVTAAVSGFLRPSRVYFIDDSDSYCPGMFQNLVLPRLELRWDELDVGARLDRFKWKMLERLRHERRMRPHAHLRLSFSHTRREVFAPHVVRSVDENDFMA